MDSTKYGHYIVTDLRAPERVMARAPEYGKWAKRILWMDGNVVPGAFQMNNSWYCAPNPPDSAEQFSHRHDCDEIIGFFGSNYQDPYDLGAEIEFWIEDEMHLITSSAMIFVPANVNHCPLTLRRVDRPIFHYSVVTGHSYEYIRNEWQPER